MLKRTTLTACSPLLQCGPEGVRGQLCPQEPDLSEHQTWPRSVDDDQRNTFLHGPSVHYGCQVQVLDVQNVLNEKKIATLYNLTFSRWRLAVSTGVYLLHFCGPVLCCNNAALRGNPPLSKSEKS